MNLLPYSRFAADVPVFALYMSPGSEKVRILEVPCRAAADLEQSRFLLLSFALILIVESPSSPSRSDLLELVPDLSRFAVYMPIR